jgi:hypothetical protein
MFHGLVREHTDTESALCLVRKNVVRLARMMVPLASEGARHYVCFLGWNRVMEPWNVAHDNEGLWIWKNQVGLFHGILVIGS